MSVTYDQAVEHLNIGDDSEVVGKLAVFIDAANDWIEAKVTDTLPESVSVLATLSLIEHWWERSQRGPASAAPVGGDYATIDGRTYAIPNEVRELLDGFLTEGTSPAPSGSFPDAVAWPDTVEWPA